MVFAEWRAALGAFAVVVRLSHGRVGSRVGLVDARRSRAAGDQTSGGRHGWHGPHARRRVHCHGGPVSPRPAALLGGPVLATLLGVATWLGARSDSGGPPDLVPAAPGSASGIRAGP